MCKESIAGGGRWWVVGVVRWVREREGLRERQHDVKDISMAWGASRREAGRATTTTTTTTTRG